MGTSFKARCETNGFENEFVNIVAVNTIAE